ncbi:hypothetical protein ETD85_03185 [Nonomuraea zeae]|uniref:Tyr recombinase domain-containing protein n=1 Tax=Nonomuraea zeae TaxID=1642303 RepID=A0A5S4H0Z0_9ACTN|nr:hypothetical protein ETD85_03185 [Nonomuraea zeae]
MSGLLPPSPAPPGSGCPQLHLPAATGSAVKVFHLHSTHRASRRTHDLRHTHATILIAGGKPLKMVAERLGHADPAITLRVYAHVMPGNQREAADWFAALVESA